MKEKSLAQKLTEKFMTFFMDVKVDLTVQKVVEGPSIEIDETTGEVFEISDTGERIQPLADGDYTLETGATIKVTDGKIVEANIEDVPADEELDKDEVEAGKRAVNSEQESQLSSQIALLKSDNEKLVADLKLKTDEIVKLTADFKALNEKLETLTKQSVEKLAKAEEKNNKETINTGPMSPKQLAQAKLVSELNK